MVSNQEVVEHTLEEYDSLYSISVYPEVIYVQSWQFGRIPAINDNVMLV